MRDVIAARRTLLLSTYRYLGALARTMRIGTADLYALMELAAGELAPKDLGAALGFTSASITILVDRLEAAGLVERKRHPTDRRALLLRLTARGRRLVRRLDRLIASDAEPAVGRLPWPEREHIRTFLAVLTERQTARASEVLRPGSTESPRPEVA